LIAEYLKRAIEALATVPDHLWALCVVALGSLLTVCHQTANGQALIAAGLAMWRGQSK
jgi:hypothetical protein